ncbi:hypothetical protein L484_006953 [Morus notabilis]|uniref:Uncharacterized protein n=1 Tax=Morus notabilis TaxID=981085 RepID=W9QSC9_9ROSA|nr:hypothetical protein L484_006953 [Morus notabilis]
MIKRSKRSSGGSSFEPDFRRFHTNRRTRALGCEPESSVDPLHRRKEVAEKGGVVEGEDLVSDEDGGDLHRREVGLDVGLDLGLGLAGSWILDRYSLPRPTMSSIPVLASV